MDEEQLIWALNNIGKDEEHLNEKITDVFEILKPWLNNELYWHIKKEEDGKEKFKQEQTEAIKNMKGLGLPENMEFDVVEQQFDDLPEVFE